MRTLLTTLFVLSAACGGNLDVGDGPGHDGGGNTKCAMSDCSAYKITCSSGQPTNLQCAYDTAISGCSLTGECSDSAGTQTCSYTPPPACSGSGPCSDIGGVGVGGEIDLVGDPTTTSTSLVVYLGDVSTQTIGDCSFNPYADESTAYILGQPMFNVGTVSATASGFALSVSPLCDGSYPPASVGQLVDQGAVVSFNWTGSSWSGSKPTFPNVPGPHGITVTSGAPSTLPRSNDLSLAWTQLATPLSLEQVGFELTQGSSRLECRFTSSTNAGTVPADALLQFKSGPAQFRMFSVHAAQGNSDMGATTFAVQRAAAAGTLHLN
jgi:hypothetical protein